MRKVYDWMGGRKMTAGFYASLLLTAVALFSDASFSAYAAAVLVALGITSGSVAYEDAARAEGGSH